MTLRSFLQRRAPRAACAAALLGAVACIRAPQSATPPPMSVTVPSGVSDRAMQVYREAHVVDVHNDMPTRMLDDGYDPDVRHAAGFTGEQGHTDLPRLLESGITAQFFSAWVDAPYARATPDQSFARAIRYIDAIHAFVGRHPGRLLFATTAADVRRAKEERRVAVLIGVEGGHAIEGSIEKLRVLHQRGVRYMTLTWNNGNAWAGSSVGVDGTRTGGLTDFGRDVVREMNRLGMLVDISHVSDSTFWDVIATTSSPVIASHSSARALAEHRRNISDDMLRAVAKSGGVVNVNFYSRFISADNARARAAIDADLDTMRAALLAAPGADSAAADRQLRVEEARRLAAVPPVPLSVLIDHIDHIARTAGVAHVGLGSDFDGVSALPADMEDVTRLPRIADALLARGYSAPDVQKILGGNMMRVMGQVLDRRVAPDR